MHMVLVSFWHVGYYFVYDIHRALEQCRVNGHKAYEVYQAPDWTFQHVEDKADANHVPEATTDKEEQGYDARTYEG
jgi:hypothetical protein